MRSHMTHWHLSCDMWLTFEIWYLQFSMCHLTCEMKHWTCLELDIWHMTYDIWLLTFDFWLLTFDIWHLTFDIWLLTFDFWHLISYLTFAIWYNWHWHWHLSTIICQFIDGFWDYLQVICRIKVWSPSKTKNCFYLGIDIHWAKKICLE